MINQGVSFGWQLPGWLGWIALGIVGWLLVKEKGSRLGLGLMFAGGSMNMLSRIRWGGVRDELVFLGWLHNTWADYLLVIGLIVYLGGVCRSK